MRPELRRWLPTLCLALTACQGFLTEPDGSVRLPPAADSGVVDGGLAKSAKGNIRFKGDVRFTAELSQILQLGAPELCSELGMYPCTTYVHVVALGGVDPYGKGLFEAPPTPGVAAPVVVDRVVLSACAARVQKDLATPSTAVIFKSIPLTSDGKLVDSLGQPVRNAITELSRRAWLREVSVDELGELTDLALQIQRTGVANPGVQWMQAACFAVLTSTEAVFY